MQHGHQNMVNRYRNVAWDDESKQIHESITSHCIALEAFLNNAPDGRSKSQALTKLEEFHMWCGKAVRDWQLNKGDNNA